MAIFFTGAPLLYRLFIGETPVGPAMILHGFFNLAGTRQGIKRTKGSPGLRSPHSSESLSGYNNAPENIHGRTPAKNTLSRWLRLATRL